MKKLTLFAIALFLNSLYQINAQSIESDIPNSFEDFNIPSGDYWNGSDGTGDFFLAGSNTRFQNVYSNELGGFWEKGWAISKVKDDTTSGFENMYASFAGSGFYSQKYAVGQQNAYIKFSLPPSSLSFAITNTTYSGLSMKNGDSIAKRFGGESGNDPDYFKLIVKGYRNNQPVGTDFEFFLADFRFENNNQDYILKDWDYFYMNFHSGGSLPEFDTYPDSVVFTMESSDVGEFGMKTPAFFCLDFFTESSFYSIGAIDIIKPLRLFPNPSKNELNIDLSQVNSVTLNIFNIDGKKVMSETFGGEMEIKKMDVSSIENGFYVVEILTSKNQRMVGRFVKND